MKYTYPMGTSGMFAGAPQSATHVLRHKVTCELIWAENFDYMCLAQYVDGHRPPFKILNPTMFDIIAERCLVIEWDGMGLPPVGIECEVLFTSGGSLFEKAKILYSDNNVVIGRWLSGDRCGVLFDYKYILSDYRPARSLEKTEREKAITDISEFIVTFQSSFTVAAALYDAGYRKCKN